MQSSSDKIDDESIKFLQDVKKGKPRKFVMIKEGVQIDKLYIFKKGPFDRYVRLAKQEGVRGEAFWGVVRGDGVDIQFELSRADGFENPPGTEIRLKEFLKEETSYKFEPNYVIVETLTPIEEAEAEAPVEEGAAEAKVEEDAGPKFIDLLKKILPHVKRALAKPTSVSAELQSRVREAQELGRQRDFQQGLATLKIVGQLTKQALAEAEAAPAATGPAQEFLQRSKKVRILAQDSEVAETSVAREVARRLDEADALAQRNQIDRANRAIERAERCIELAQAETRRRQQWEERFAELEP
ncbi:MAG TPA: hypothetical protein VHK01_20320, partial [Lacipirellulaceae bacterium]|nr:hypothetical protein [Lacipirellulaceae bacterium]